MCKILSDICGVFNNKRNHRDGDGKEIFCLLNIDDIRRHFNTVRDDDEFSEDTYLIDKIKNGLKPNRKNIFILDDVYEITEIIRQDLVNYLGEVNRLTDFNIITLCKKTCGFDMVSIIANHPEIKVDAILTDIIFGGNEKINGKKIIIDGVDLVILLMRLNPDIKYALFTGTAFSEKNENGSRIATKFEGYTGESILTRTFMKDANVIFDKVIFDSIVGQL